MATRRKPHTNQNQTIRKKRQMFWLDSHNEKHLQTWDIIEDMKAKRRFNPSVIDGLRLMADLQAGRTEVLGELFPWAVEQGKKASGGGDKDGISRIIQLLEMQRLPLPDVSHVPYASKELMEKSPTGKPKLIDKEPEIEIKQDTTAAHHTVWNNLIAMAALSGNWGMLSAEIMDYGIQIGRIPATAAKPKKPTPPPAPVEEKGPKKMDVPQFAPPTFEDDDDLPIAMG